MLPEPYVVLLDDRTLSDDLFARGFGRMLAGSARPLVLVHGDGGAAAQAFEAHARFDASQAETDEARALAAFVLNRKLASAWSDAGAAVTGLGGEGRALFRRTNGAVAAANVAFVQALLAQRVVPLVAARALNTGPTDAGRMEAVPLAQAVAALATALGGTAVALFRTGAPPLGDVAWSPEDLADHRASLADAEGATGLAEAGVPLLVAAPAALVLPGELRGARLVQDKEAGKDTKRAL